METTPPLWVNSNDLNEHFYILGRSGTGKSNLLKQLAVSDAKRGAGLCFIDPIGTTATELVAELQIMSRQAENDVPCRNKTPHIENALNNLRHDASVNISGKINETPFTDKDIIYFDAADTENPIGVNPLYNIEHNDRAKAVSDTLQMFSGIWHKTGWGARMESIFRATLHTLIENPIVCAQAY